MIDLARELKLSRIVTMRAYNLLYGSRGRLGVIQSDRDQLKVT